MKVLVLGATGLAGSAIMRTLQTNGHDVSGTCRKSMAHGGNPAMLHFDVGKPESIVPLLEKNCPDVVISSLRGDFTCQLEAHRLAADFLLRRGGTFVYLSTANVFDGELSQPHYETDPPCSDSTYGQFKIACERLLQSCLGERCVILRPPEIWGSDCPRLRTLVQSIRDGSPIQTYENLSVNYTLDTQIARWVSFILAQSLQGVFHVGTWDTCDYTTFLDRLALRLKLSQPIYTVERNQTPLYQAVLPGRNEIPKELQLSVDGILDYLSEHC